MAISRLFRREKLDNYLKSDQHFAKTMSAKDLMSLGIGAVIGTGIFILPGTIAAQYSGPGIVLSFLLAAIVCSTAAMCYAEFASVLPVAGFHLTIPTAVAGPFDPAKGTYGNLVAILVVFLISWLLNRGMRESMRINNAIVIVKIAIIILFVVVGAFYVRPENWQPFAPFGSAGIRRGAATVFFAYLGFDVVSSSAAEVKNPRRNMPIGIIGTLVVATILYMLVAIVLTGMVPYTKLNVADPVAFALTLVHQDWTSGIISLGALAGMFTMMVTMIYSSSRLIYSVGRDGLLPKFLGKIDDQTGTPKHSLAVVTVVIALLGGFVPLDQLTNLVNIGTLVAFLFVSFGIMRLRHLPEMPHNTGFKVPFYPVLPIISGLLCFYMMLQLPAETWIASTIWFALGLVIYLTYGLRHSRLNDQS